MLKVKIVPVTPFQQNCSVLWCDQTMEAAVVDPGGDLDKIQTVLDREGLALKAIWITHGHIDHCGAAQTLKDQTSVPIIGPHEEDMFWITRLEEDGARYQFNWAKTFAPDQFLNDGDKLTIGQETLDVYHCPGHTPGHVVLYHEGQKLAIVGDVLFKGSVGRTDFPRGNTQELIDSIVQKLWPLGGDVRFIPGHGPMSTFAEERASNPFVGDQVLAG